MTPANPDTKSQVRKHYYLDQYVVIAPKRTHSLHHEEFAKTGILRQPPLEDEPSVYEVAGEDGKWEVKVISNLYPAFSTANPEAYGVQEVILEARDPSDIPLGRFPLEHIEKVFGAYRQRITALSQLKHINYVSVFHNQGLEAGASVKQTHSQIIATELVPPTLRRHAEAFTRLRRRYGVSPLARAISWEREQRLRVIYSDRYISAVCPYASLYPFEVWIVPRGHIKSITELSRAQLRALAVALKAVTLGLETERISYNFHLIEPIRGMDNHFMIELIPRPNVWGGFEFNTGVAINPVAPEDAAEWYRSFIEERDAL